MSNERRRYFRIDEAIGLSYEIIDDEMSSSSREYAPDVFELISKQDKELEKLLLDVEKESPKIAKLVSIFNQKLERVVSHLALETKLVDRIASKIKEANISACGIAFKSQDFVMEGTRVRLSLTLYPSEKVVQTDGFVVGCEQVQEDQKQYFWRVDFFNMSETAQETLIQHIVQSQSQQLSQKWQSPKK